MLSLVLFWLLLALLLPLLRAERTEPTCTARSLCSKATICGMTMPLAPLCLIERCRRLEWDEPLSSALFSASAGAVSAAAAAAIAYMAAEEVATCATGCAARQRCCNSAGKSVCVVRPGAAAAVAVLGCRAAAHKEPNRLPRLQKPEFIEKTII